MFPYSGWAFCAVSKALKCVAARSRSLGELSGSALWRIRLACPAGTAPAIADSRWRSDYAAPLCARSGNRPRGSSTDRAAHIGAVLLDQSREANPAAALAAMAIDFQHRQLALKLAKRD